MKPNPLASLKNLTVPSYYYLINYSQRYAYYCGGVSFLTFYLIKKADFQLFPKKERPFNDKRHFLRLVLSPHFFKFSSLKV